MNTLPKLVGVCFNRNVGGALLMGLGIALLTNSISSATVASGRSIAPQQEISTIAQLFKNPPSSSSSSAQRPASCGPQGCRLSIDQTLLQSGQKVIARYQGKDQQIIQTGETRALIVQLAEPIVNRAGQVVIPAESEISGQVVPIEGGGQFIAKQITVNGRPYAFPAKSSTLHDVKDPRETSAGSIAGDAAIGAAGGAVVGQVLNGKIGIGEVLVGAATGVVIGNVTAPRTVVISTGDQIELQLTDQFRL